MLAVAMVSIAQTPNAAQAPDLNLQTIQAILEQPEQQIDLTRAKLTIDHMVDPSIDIEANVQRLDHMVRIIRTEIPANSTSRERLEALRGYLYEDGAWNGNQGFRYDFNDPLGQDVRNKLLPTYLATKRGNCISMPFLFIALAQKLDINVTAAQAPAHVFVKYRDEAGKVFNVEATNKGAFQTDASYQRSMPMTKQALANGVYLRALSKRETVALMTEELMEVYEAQGAQQDQLIALIDLALKYHPKWTHAMILKSNSYFDLRKRYFVDKYPRPQDIPAAEIPRFKELQQNYEFWGAKATALGWLAPSPQSEANYLQYIARIKSTQ